MAVDEHPRCTASMLRSGCAEVTPFRSAQGKPIVATTRGSAARMSRCVMRCRLRGGTCSTGRVTVHRTSYILLKVSILLQQPCHRNLFFFTNLSSKFDENLPGRSQFDSDHRVNFSTPTSCQSASFVRPLFTFVFCFYDKKSSKKKTCGESVSIGVTDQVRSANDDPNALLQINL